jgi:hypothetical protein
MKKNEMGGACSTYGERNGRWRVLVGMSEGRRQLGKLRWKWEDNIKWSFKTWDEGSGLNRSGLGQGQVAVSCEGVINIRVS